MYTYLALGDSYTIGEQVPLQQSFPYQVVEVLAKQKIEVAEPVIVARTGWTTDELTAALREEGIREIFTFVSLLIGVNNQYRGRSLENYEEEFTSLINQAIIFANGHTQNVFVLSIPDWGVTPFAHDRDRTAIAKEIDAYNDVNRRVTEAHGCRYLDITASTRANGNNVEYLAGDGLHPSAKEYQIWAERLAPLIGKSLKS